MSRRDISWQTFDCRTKALINKNSETFWFYDKIELNQRNQVMPIREALRPDYRYLSLLNFNGWNARTPPGSPLGAYGTISVESHQKLFKTDTDAPIDAGEFSTLNDDAQQETDRIARYDPKIWPIFYDERSHKPHSEREPLAWISAAPMVAENTLRGKIEWDGCDGKQIKAVMTVPPGGMPAAGPNRPGRDDHGTDKMEVVEKAY